MIQVEVQVYCIFHMKINVISEVIKLYVQQSTEDETILKENN